MLTTAELWRVVNWLLPAAMIFVTSCSVIAAVALLGYMIIDMVLSFFRKK